MGLIDRFILKEILKTLLIMVFVLVVLLLSNLLVRYLGKAASGLIDADVLLIIVGLEMVKAIGLIIPPAFFFAVLWVLGRMYRDSEMVALNAAGFGLGRIFQSILITAVPLSLLVVVLVMEVLPWSKGYVTRLKAEQANQVDITGIKAGRFNEFNRGGLVAYTERLSADGARIEDVFVQDRQHGKLGLVTADQAYQTTDPETGARFVILTDGRRYEGQPGRRDYMISEFDEYAVSLPSVEVADVRMPRSAKSWQALLGSDELKDWAELQFRVSVPLALIAFAILAVPLSRSPPRSGVYGRLSVAILLYFTFMNLQRIAERWLEDGIVPAWLGMWWLPVLMIVAAVVIILLDSNWFAYHRRRWMRGRP